MGEKTSTDQDRKERFAAADTRCESLGTAMTYKIPELTYGDTEIGVIAECYKSLQMLDRDGQNRALNWLHSRLEQDTQVKPTPSQTEGNP